MTLKNEYTDYKNNTHAVKHTVVTEKNNESEKKQILEELFYILSNKNTKSNYVVD